MTEQPSLSQINQKLKRNQKISPVEKLVVYQAANRIWRRHLSPQEIVAMTYVVDRTIGWGKNRFVAAHANVICGTEDFSGIGLPERTYFRALRTLQEKGLVGRQSRRDRTMIVLNVDWLPTCAEVSPATQTSEGADVEERHDGTPRSIKSCTPRTATVAAKDCQIGSQELPRGQHEYSKGSTVVRIP